MRPFPVTALRFGLALVLALSVAGMLVAQQDSEPAMLVDIPVGDNFVISVPNDWITYRRQDYPNARDATAFLQQTYDAILPNTVSINPQELQITEFLAIRPQPYSGGLVQVRMSVLPLDVVAQMVGAEPAQVTAEQLAQAQGAESVRMAEVNGRAVGVIGGTRANVQQIGVAMVFPELRTAVLASFFVPPDYTAVAEGLIHAILLSIRTRGEPFSVEAWEAFNSRAFPAVIQPPPAATPTASPQAAITATPAASGPIDPAELMAVCPDGPSEILFISNRDGNLELYIANADGSDVRRVTFTDVNEEFAAWSPDGTQIVYHANPGDPDVFLMNADGTNVRNLTNNPGPDWLPRFSPDGLQIAFYSLRDARDEIYAMNADGSNVRQLTNEPGGDQFPAWSPDGTQIAFSSLRDGDAEIFVMSASGENVRQLTSNTASDVLPVWSPDGQRLLFFSNRDGDNEVFVMNADGTEPHQLTANEHEDVSTDWSPDGAFILYSSDEGGDREIWVMRADGSGALQLTDNDADDNTPMWRPCGGDTVVIPPTAVATPTEPVSCTITTGGPVNFRTGPGTNFGVQGTFPAGTTIQANGQALGADGQVWWRLENGAWARSDVVEESGNCQALPTVAP